LHLASAEFAKVDILLTVDDQFIISAKRTDSKIKPINPTDFVNKKFKKGN